MKEFLIGRLNLDALPHEYFTIGSTVAYLGLILIVAAILTRTKRWKWLWNEWLTSVDPKKIGIMYFLVAAFMLARGGVEVLMIWVQQAVASGNSGYLSSDHFQQIFTAHGNIMVFFVAMGFIFGLINYIVPLQIGARDLAPWCRCRLLDLEPSDFGDRHYARCYKLHHDNIKDACARHDLNEDAAFYLGIIIQYVNGYRSLPIADCDPLLTVL
jgi:hypothetical protein